MDLLSAKKVRLHGICDSRWTTKDKIVQYKGLVRLYQRDSKIITENTGNLIRSHTKEISKLNKMIKIKKDELENVLKARKWKLDSMLIPFKGIRLICQSLTAEEMMEQVKQIVFSERKRLDIIRFNRERKERQLTALKMHSLELAEQVNTKFTTKSMIKTTNECQRVTGRIQDMKLLFEAAISVSNFYKIIQDLLCKDSIFYTQILFVLYGDKLKQNRCIIEATLLGQIAIENLDDKKSDFKKLHVVINKAHHKRNEDINEAKLYLQNISNTFKSLIRKDERDLSIIEENDEELQMMRSQLEDDLTRLKMTIMVPNFEDILPSLIAQDKLEGKLQNLLSSLKSNHEKLSKRVDHGKILLDVISNSEYEDTLRYFNRKKSLEDEINEKKLQAERCRREREYYTKILADMRVSIQNMKMFCEVVNDSNKVEQWHDTRNELKDDIFYIIYKIKCLMTSLEYEEVEKTDLTIEGDAYQEFSSYHIEIIDAEVEDDDDFPVDNVLTYFDIKEQSRQIVQNYKDTIF